MYPTLLKTGIFIGAWATFCIMFYAHHAGQPRIRRDNRILRLVLHSLEQSTRQTGTPAGDILRKITHWLYGATAPCYLNRTLPHLFRAAGTLTCASFAVLVFHGLLLGFNLAEWLGPSTCIWVFFSLAVSCGVYIRRLFRQIRCRTHKSHSVIIAKLPYASPLIVVSVALLFLFFVSFVSWLRGLQMSDKLFWGWCGGASSLVFAYHFYAMRAPRAAYWIVITSISLSTFFLCGALLAEGNSNPLYSTPPIQNWYISALMLFMFTHSAVLFARSRYPHYVALVVTSSIYISLAWRALPTSLIGTSWMYTGVLIISICFLVVGGAVLQAYLLQFVLRHASQRATTQKKVLINLLLSLGLLAITSYGGSRALFFIMSQDWSPFRVWIDLPNILESLEKGHAGEASLMGSGEMAVRAICGTTTLIALMPLVLCTLYNLMALLMHRRTGEFVAGLHERLLIATQEPTRAMRYYRELSVAAAGGASVAVVWCGIVSMAYCVTCTV